MNTFKKLIKRLCGSTDVMSMKMRSTFTDGGADEITAKMKKSKNTWLALIVGFVLVLIFSCTAVKTATSLDSINRESQNGKALNIPAEISASYESAKIKSSGSLLVAPESIPSDDIALMMDDLESRLPKMLLNGNVSLEDIKQDLFLPGNDSVTNIDITWESDEEQIIAPNGNINMVDGKPGDVIILTALFRIGEASKAVEFETRLGTPAADYDYEADLRESVNRTVLGIAEDSSGSKVKLPTKTAGGAKLKWTTPSDFAPLFAPVFIVLIGVVLYKRRYHWMNFKIKEARASVTSDYPSFVNKLILLLNAGMVISSAISKIADDYRAQKREDTNRYFYNELCGMEDRIRSSNSMLATEFSELANRTQSREVMRFSSVLSGSLDTGSSLAESLDRESNLLWEMRKKSAEEKGRIAESKLTFPMVLQLLAIILITVAPAVIQMQ